MLRKKLNYIETEYIKEEEIQLFKKSLIDERSTYICTFEKRHVYYKLKSIPTLACFAKQCT